MRKRIVVLAVVVGLLLFIAPSTTNAASPERRCPRIHEAIHALEVALHEMEEGRHDFCGHKREAMEATRHAIEQLRRAEDCESCR